MQAGKLPHPIVIERPGPATKNEFSEDETPTWIPFARVWAGIRPLSSRELWNAQQVQPDITHEITIRYFPGITSLMRIKFGTRTFEILTPPLNTNERNYELKMMCRESV